MNYSKDKPNSENSNKVYVNNSVVNKVLNIVRNAKDNTINSIQSSI